MGGGGAIAPATFVDWRKMSTSFDAMSVFRGAHLQRHAGRRRAGEARGAALVVDRSSMCLACRPCSAAPSLREDGEPGNRRVWFSASASGSASSPAARTSSVRSIRLNGQPLHRRRRDAGDGELPGRTPNFWVPRAVRPAWLRWRRADPRGHRGAHCLRGVARLKAGDRRSRQANAELSTISDQLARQYPEESSNFIGLATPLQDGWCDRRGRRCSSCSARSAACC